MSIRVMYDGEAFLEMARGGIPRYLAALVQEFSQDPALGISPVTPYKWVASRHLAEHDSRFIEIPLPRRIRLKTLRRLNRRRLKKAEPADVVHHSTYKPVAFEQWPGRKHITTVYDFMLERFPSILPEGDDHPVRFDEVIRRADAIICISQTTREDFYRFYPDHDKPVFAIPLGVSETFFDPAPAKLPALPAKYVLNVSNRMPHKNVDALIDAFADVATRHPDLHLVLVGAPAPTEDARLTELGILDRTVRLRVRDAALPWLYRRATAFVYPSIWEGFGLPVLEAMASGCPAVVSNVAALTEVSGDAALIFDLGDKAALIEHIERIVTDEAEAARLRAAGVDRARQFTWRRTAELTAEVYQKVAAG